jgi:DNA polymerase-3 subunit beta
MACFECDREELVLAVNNVQKAISARTTIPLLEGIELTANDGQVVLYGSDNEIGIECTIRARVEREGAVVVNGKLFGDIIRNMPLDTVRIDSAGDIKVRLVSGEAQFEIFAVQTDAFPTFPEVEQDREYRLDQFTLKKMFTQTAFAIGVDDLRKTLTGLFLECGDGEVRAVAVDGYRIALRRQPVQQENEGYGMIIPARTINELIKIIPSGIGELRLSSGKNQAVIAFENCRVYTRLIDGEFFNYRYLLPNEYMTQITLRRQSLLDAVERAALIISSEQVRRFPVVFKVAGDQLSIRALSDVGNAGDEIETEMEGEDIEVAFNPRFMIETLRAIEDETIVIRFTSRVGQCIIKPVNNENYTYLILPVKVGE